MAEPMAHVLKPCAQCGVDVLVHPYAATKYVKCPAHKGLTPVKKMQGRRSVLNPFDPGLEMAERQERAVGAIVLLKRRVDPVSWEEELTVASIREFDEEAGTAKVLAQGGSQFQPPYDIPRESGQHHAFHLSEVVGVR